MVKTKAVFNLEFPWNCKEFSIANYRFERKPDADYEIALNELHHRIDMTGEFEVKKCDGGHACTGYIFAPEPEEGAVLNFEWDNAKAMSDILILLSLFTGRDVFAQDVDRIGGYMDINYDQRSYYYGQTLITSINFEASSDDSYASYDAGFGRTLDDIYSLIKSESWQETYNGGQFLKLMFHAMQSRSLEIAFSSCWTIWEHLFAILNENWLAPDQIEKLRASEKISFLIVRFALKKTLSHSDKERIASLANIRNRLVHYGFFPDRDNVREDALLFVHMTEYIVARILGLQPSQVFDTMKRFEKFIDKSTKVTKRSEKRTK